MLQATIHQCMWRNHHACLLVEAIIKESIGLVHDQPSDLIKLDGTFSQQLKESERGCDQHICHPVINCKFHSNASHQVSVCLV